MVLKLEKKIRRKPEVMVTTPSKHPRVNRIGKFLKENINIPIYTVFTFHDLLIKADKSAFNKCSRKCYCINQLVTNDKDNGYILGKRDNLVELPICKRGRSFLPRLLYGYPL